MENYRKFLRKREKKRKRACEKIKRYIKYKIYVGYFLFLRSHIIYYFMSIKKTVVVLFYFKIDYRIIKYCSTTNLN